MGCWTHASNYGLRKDIMFQDEFNDGFYGAAREEEAQERALRLNTLCRVYEQADRVLSGDPVTVNVVLSGPAPAWSDGASITFNAEYIDDMDLETLTQVTGLNYHELCHHLYTPRKGTEMMKWVMENNYMESMNILEDQRIETLFTARFPSVIPFLTATCARWLAESEDEIAGNYIAIRGRRYLPVEIREAFRDAFAFPNLIPVIARVVDEYRLLTFPKDYKRAQELIQELNDLVLKPAGILDDMRRDPNTKQGGPNGCGGRAPISKGRPEPGKAQEKDAQRAQGMGTPESPYKSKPGAGSGNGSVDPKDIVNPKDDKHQDGNGSPTQTTTQQQALDIRDSKVDTYTPQPAGVGHNPSVGGVPKDVIKGMLSDTIDDVLARKDVQQDIKTKQKVIVGGDGKHDDVTKRGKFDLTAAPTDAIVAYRRFAQELQRLRDDSEPHWVKETPTGKFNVNRVMKGCDPDQAFDRWDEGDDGCDIEAVILVDRSGSMSSGRNDQKASVACWTIKRALEHIEAPVTVYAFDDQNEVAYTREERANRTQYKFIYGNGGTHPYPALLAAEQLLMASRKKNKMLFLITDGEFNADKNDELIKRIASRGVLTAMTLIMNEKGYNQLINDYGRTPEEFRHGAEIFGRVNGADDLLPFAKAVVTGAIKKRSRVR